MSGGPVEPQTSLLLFDYYDNTDSYNNLHHRTDAGHSIKIK
jgi:hypothetical protein